MELEPLRLGDLRSSATLWGEPVEVRVVLWFERFPDAEPVTVPGTLMVAESIRLEAPDLTFAGFNPDPASKHLSSLVKAEQEASPRNRLDAILRKLEEIDGRLSDFESRLEEVEG